MLTRCPSCRTLCDPEQDARCFACGGELGKPGPIRPIQVPEVLRAGKRDKTSSSALLAVLAVLGGIGVTAMLLNPEIPLLPKILLGVLLLATAVLGTMSMKESRTTAAGSVGRSLLKLFAFFGVLIAGTLALGIALVLLLLITCASGILR
jgi:hypothetical protein